MSGVAVSREAAGTVDTGGVSGTARPRGRRRRLRPGRVVAFVLATVWLVIAVAVGLVRFTGFASMASQQEGAA